MWSKGMRPQSVATARASRKHCHNPAVPPRVTCVRAAAGPSTRASYGRRGPLASPMTTTRGSLPTHFLDEAGHQGDRFDRLAVSLEFGQGSTDTSGLCLAARCLTCMAATSGQQPRPATRLPTRCLVSTMIPQCRHCEEALRRGLHLEWAQTDNDREGHGSRACWTTNWS